MANGQDIETLYLEQPVISIVQAGAFEEIEARLMAGLTQAEYDALPGTPDWLVDEGPSISKSHVIAFFRLRHRIDAVYAEAQRRAAKNK